MSLTSGSVKRSRVGVRRRAARARPSAEKKAALKNAKAKPYRKKRPGPVPHPDCRARLLKDGKCRIISQSVVVRGGCLHKNFKSDGPHGGHKVSLPVLEVSGKHFLVVLMRNLAWCRLLTGRSPNEGSLSSQPLFVEWREKLAKAKMKNGTCTLYMPESRGSEKQRKILCMKKSGQLTLECTADNLNWLLQNMGECTTASSPADVESDSFDVEPGSEDVALDTATVPCLARDDSTADGTLTPPRVPSVEALPSPAAAQTTARHRSRLGGRSPAEPTTSPRQLTLQEFIYLRRNGA